MRDMQLYCVSSNDKIKTYKNEIYVGATLYYAGDIAFNGEKVYNADTMPDGIVESDVFKIPVSKLLDIAVESNGDGGIHFTIEPYDNFNTASFSLFTGTPINKAVTGFKIKRNSGIVNVKVTIKTF